MSVTQNSGYQEDPFNSSGEVLSYIIVTDDDRLEDEFTGVAALVEAAKELLKQADALIEDQGVK